LVGNDRFIEGGVFGRKLWRCLGRALGGGKSRCEKGETSKSDEQTKSEKP